MENNEQVPQNQEAVKNEQPAVKPAATAAATRRPAGRKHYGSRRKVCRLCAEHVEEIDYKQIPVLRTFCTDTGKILSRRITGTCAKHQRQITKAIKINRNLSLMPYSK